MFSIEVPQVATLAGIDLQVENREFFGGAVFRLAQTEVSMGPTRTATVILDDGAEASVYNRLPFVIARLPKAMVTHFPAETIAQNVLATSHEACQRTLDVLSMKAEPQDLVIENAFVRHYLWWRRSGDVTLRFILGMDSAAIEQNMIPLIQAPPPWHQAFRYFRLSQTANDLYDAYRNMWLALESALSELQAKSGSETEDAWLRRTLQQVHTDLDLAHYVAKPSKDSVQAFLDEQYRAARSSIFHAKKGQRPIIPGSIVGREHLGKALTGLYRLVDDVLARYLQSQRQSLRVEPLRYEAAIKQISAEATLALFEEEISDAMAGDYATVLAPPHVDMHTTFVASGFHGDAPSITGRTAAYPIHLRMFKSVALYVPKRNLIFTKEALDILSLEGIDTLEATMTFALNIMGDARVRFSA